MPEESGNPYYKEALDSRSLELGVTPQLDFNDLWNTYTRRKVELASYIDVAKQNGADLIGPGFDSFYDGLHGDVSRVELMACLPNGWKPSEAAEERPELDYVQWPLCPSK